MAIRPPEGLWSIAMPDRENIWSSLDVTNLVTKEVKVNEKSEMLLVEDVEQPYISCPETADAGSVIKFSADSTNLPGWDISQYYWNFGDETISIGKNVEKSFNRPGNL